MRVEDIRNELEEQLRGDCSMDYITKEDWIDILSDFDEWAKTAKRGDMYLYDGMEYLLDEDDEGDEAVQFLTEHFFDLMRHNSSIVWPYYEDREFAENIALEYIADHPDFTVPPMTDGIYVYTDRMLNELENYCNEKCAAYGYDGSDSDDEEEFLE